MNKGGSWVGVASVVELYPQIEILTSFGVPWLVEGGLVSTGGHVVGRDGSCLSCAKNGQSLREKCNSKQGGLTWEKAED